MGLRPNTSNLSAVLHLLLSTIALPNHTRPIDTHCSGFEAAQKHKPFYYGSGGAALETEFAMHTERHTPLGMYQ